MTLRSWDDPAQEERLLLHSEERARLWGGQPVVVLVRRGFFGVPWVSAVEPDFEAQSREVLELVPEATGVWKELALFNVRINRLDEARRVAAEYFARFPQSPEFPVHIARILTRRDRFADVAALLSPVAVRHEDADVYMLLGYALGMQGRRVDGLHYLEKARALQPDHWWPHYALGWVHSTHGDTASAVLSFERALQLRPGLPDAEAQLARLRPHVAGRNP
jgi:tetratricopeptide (TPR) repeat protein